MSFWNGTTTTPRDISQARCVDSCPVTTDCTSYVAGGDSGGAHIYKFKQGITKRFSEQKTASFPSYSLSRRPSDDVIDVDHSSNDDVTDNPIHSGKKMNFQMVLSRNHSGDKTYDDHVIVPAFVLHPSGAYYVPVKIITPSVEDLIPHSPSSNSETHHPVNIPVSFSKPCCWIQNGDSKSTSKSTIETDDCGYFTETKDAFI